jgi:hypothetical protein
MNAVWTKAEKDFVANNAHCLTDLQIAEHLFNATGRLVSRHAVRQVRVRLGIKKAQGRGRCEVVSRPSPPQPPTNSL